ncbi:sensor histidine kinase [Hymenobacter coalescens]
MRPWFSLCCLGLLLAAPGPAGAVPPADTAQVRRWSRQARQELFSRNDSALRRSRRIIGAARQLAFPEGLAQGYLLLGSALRNKSAFDSSLYYGQQALTLFERQADAGGQAAAYNLMAQTYKRLGDAQAVPVLTRRALRLAHQAAAAARRSGQYSELSRAFLTQGIVYRDLNQLDSARQCYLRAMNVEQRHRPQPSFLPVCYANYGQFLMDSGADLAEAIRYFQRAIPLYEQQNNRNGLEHAYRNLSWAYRQQQRPGPAIEAAERSLALGRASGDPHRLCNSLQAAYLAYRAAGRYQRAVELLEEWKKRQDALVSVDITRAVASVEAAYAAEKKEAQIAHLAEANASQRRQLWGLGAGAGLLLLLLGVSGWQQRVIRRTNGRLRATNDTISAQHQRISEQAARLTVLMKELHHRVKNNLAIVSSLLRLQSNRLTDAGAVRAVREGQQRVEAMALIHQRLYQTDHLGSVDMHAYVHDLAGGLLAAYGHTPAQFELTVDVRHPHLDVDWAVPLGLILNELLTNAFKYAYADAERPALRVYFGPDAAGDLVLEVQDNGPGLPPAAGVATRSFGRRLVASLAEQLGGQLEQYNHHGACYRLRLPSVPAAVHPEALQAVPA